MKLLASMPDFVSGCLVTLTLNPAHAELKGLIESQGESAQYEFLRQKVGELMSRDPFRDRPERGIVGMFNDVARIQKVEFHMSGVPHIHILFYRTLTATEHATLERAWWNLTYGGVDFLDVDRKRAEGYITKTVALPTYLLHLRRFQAVQKFLPKSMRTVREATAHQPEPPFNRIKRPYSSPRSIAQRIAEDGCTIKVHGSHLPFPVKVSLKTSSIDRFLSALDLYARMGRITQTGSILLTDIREARHLFSPAEFNSALLTIEPASPLTDKNSHSAHFTPVGLQDSEPMTPTDSKRQLRQSMLQISSIRVRPLDGLQKRLLDRLQNKFLELDRLFHRCCKALQLPRVSSHRLLTGNSSRLLNRGGTASSGD